MNAGAGSRSHHQFSEPDNIAVARWMVLREHIDNGKPLTALACEHGIPLRTLQRWHQAYKLHGKAGLEPTPRPKRGRKSPTELITLIEGLALVKPRKTTAAIHQQANKVATRQGWPPVSYSTVRSIISTMDPGMLTLAHQGPVAYRDQYELVWRRRAERPNAVWQADHTQLDLLILGADGKTIRPWLTTILDDHSRAICGYMVFTGAPSSMNTALALRQAIWPKSDSTWPMCGIPDVLYVDHGTDFTSDHLAQTAKDLHFEIVFSAVARPQGRGKIERLFGTINTELLSGLPGYLTQGSRHPHPQLTLPELNGTIADFLTHVYNQREHHEIKQTPQHAWSGNGWLPRLPATIEELNLLLLTVAKSRIVHRDGVHFQGLRYISPLLAAYVGEQVIVRYDPADIAEIRIFHRGAYLCKAVDPTHERSTVSLKEIQEARASRKRELRGQINERIATVTQHLPAKNRDFTTEPEQNKRPPVKHRLDTYQEDRS
ncbi:Mu transposase C-terminal domain-containing protein [Arthrobacter glacialis]|uniref:Mu transposase C-terminal domain-containing protein n=1 Tax=Arthrobacter glacialis TaxID=1664 RepID=UPI001FAE965A|nr:Mu transposase C-terminal domain-containing protein [Arthrobacter glacialis]